MVKKMSAFVLAVLSFLMLSVPLSAHPTCVPNFGAAQVEALAVRTVYSTMVDFDRDGQADLITVDEEGVPRTHFRTAEGFSAPVVSEYMRGIYHPAALTVGYFDGDYIDGEFVVNPLPDIAVATREGGVYLLTSDPYGYYSFRGTPVMQGFYAALAAVNFNEDEMSDLMAVDVAGGAVTLFSQTDGNWGEFAYSPPPAAAYAADEFPLAASAGYFDGELSDGVLQSNDLPDLAVLTNQGRVLLYMSDPNGQVSVQETDFEIPFAALHAVDLNQDQRTDLLAKDRTGVVHLLLRQDNGNFESSPALGQAPVAALIGAYDLNGDDNLDIITTVGEDGHFAWFGGEPNCMLPPPQP